MKTHKATRKRFKITGKGKFVARAAGQNHFNARESGKITVQKHSDRVIAKVNRKAIEKMIPYFRTTIK